MKPTHRINRRSFLRSVAGTAAIGGGALATSGCTTLANTDSDTGRWADPIGGGRGRHGRGYGGYTDADRGRYADPPGRGRGDGGGPTDSDTGRYADPVGRGRGGGGG